MSFTEQEVGSLPSATPARPQFGGSALILSITGIVLLSIIGSPAGLAVGIVLLFINGRRYRMVGIIGTALSATIMVTTIAYFAIIFGAVVHNAAPPVATAAPAATVSVPQQPTPAVVPPTPDALPTNPVETGPIQPVASTPEGTIRAIEAYRIRAYETSDPTLLAYYFAVGTNPLNDATNRATAIRVKRVKIEHLVGRLSESVTKVEIVSATPTKMVANVTVRETIDGSISNSPLINTNYRFIGRTYAVIGGRWLEIIPFNN